MLGLLGSALGLALAYGALRMLVAMAPTGLPRIHEIGIDLPVLVFTLGIALFSSLLFGAIPVFKYAGAHLNTGLREGGRTLSQSRQQHRARNFARGGAGSVGAGAADWIGTDDSHVSRFSAHAAWVHGARPVANVPLLHSGHGDSRYAGANGWCARSRIFKTSWRRFQEYPR